MKNLLITVIFCCSLIAIFTGCKKSVTDEVLENSTTVQPSVKTKINAGMVKDWLASKMSPSSPLRNTYLNKILQNLAYENMYAEKFHDKENLVIIPLKNEYFSQHAKNQKNKPLQYLLLVENEKGLIRRGDLVLFFPEDATLLKLPANSFNSFFTKEELSVNGTFTLVSLSDIKQYEMIFKDGSKDKFRLWKSEKGTNHGGGNNNPTSSYFCIDWFLVTTYYENGFPVYSTSEYVGTTCSGCPPETQCLEPEGQGSGGSPVEVPVAVTRTGVYTVKREVASYEDWEIKCSFDLSGQSFTNTANNYFTSITNGTSGCMLWGFAASSSWPASARYSIYSAIQYQSLVQNSGTTAYGHLKCKMFYPNWPASWNQPGVGPTKTDIYSEGNHWQASVALY